MFAGCKGSAVPSLSALDPPIAGGASKRAARCAAVAAQAACALCVHAATRRGEDKARGSDRMAARALHVRGLGGAQRGGVGEGRSNGYSGLG
eukprot:scaffold823_cov397-Prasinococcus_capsulatus_cf.AAC.10